MPDWRKEAEKREKEKSSGSTLQIKEGDNSIRIMPDKKDILTDGKMNSKGCLNSPYREFRMHEHVGPDDRSFRCGKNIEGKGKCWYCDVKLPELEKSTSTARRKMAANSFAREKFMVNASLFDSETNKFTKPKPWWISNGSGIPGRQNKSLASKILKRIWNNNRKDVIDPKKGYNIYIEKTGSGINTRYTPPEVEEQSTIVPASILALVEDLDSLLPKYDPEFQKATYLGKPMPKDRDKEDEEDEDEDDNDSEELNEEDSSEDSEEESEEDSEESEDSEDEEESESEEDSESEDEEDSDSDEEEKEEPKKKKKEEEDDDSEDEEEPEEDSEEEEDEDSEDSENEEESEDEEEPEEKPRSKKPVKKPVKKATSKKPVKQATKKKK
jgi:hypothetical protein